MEVCVMTPPRPKTVTLATTERRLIREALIIHAVLVLRGEEKRFRAFHRAVVHFIREREKGGGDG
jgi:hypothetical protein